jgi:hypothetical protein
MEINHSKQDIAGNLAHVWAGMALGDTGQEAVHSGTGDRTVQVFGTFGAGGSVTIQGTLDGTNWASLHDTNGVALTFTTAGIRTVLQNVLAIRPVITGGDGTTSLTTLINVRR